MPSTTPLTDAINALTTYANETTGASDTTLSDAVGTLVDGYGQGGGVEHFLEPSQMVGTMTVDSTNTLALSTALANVAVGTIVIGFCETASAFKIILLRKRGNGNVSYSTGFDADYGQTGYNKSTFTHSALGVGDTYYLFTGNNF